MYTHVCETSDFLSVLIHVCFNYVISLTNRLCYNYIFCSTFGLAKLSPNEVQRMYADAKMLEEEHSHEFTGKESKQLFKKRNNTIVMYI